MKTLLTLLCCCLLLVGLAFGAARLGLIPPQVYTWLDEAFGGSAEETSREGNSVSSDPVVSDAVQIANEQELAAVLAGALLNFEDAISAQTAIPGGADYGVYLADLTENAYSVLRRDYPELFWVGMGQYGIQWDGGAEPAAVSFSITMDYAYTPQAAGEVEAEINQVVGAILSGAPANNYEAAKYFHDWIIDNTVYDTAVAESGSTAGAEHAYNINGVFLNGKAVCEAYAKSFQFLCDRYGISCRTVFGTSEGERHAWNYVQLDGSWYLVDCTADDPVGDQDVLRWDYFLKGLDGTADEMRIGDIYREDGGNYPALSTRDYS